MDVIVLTQEYVEPLLKNMVLHLKRLIDERDEHSEVRMGFVAEEKEIWELVFLPERAYLCRNH